MEKINWEEQWALFAKNFYNGKSHIPIENKTLLLLPGPGFGDLSHPTTRIMLFLMKQHIIAKPVVDLGSGCGILALGAMLMGAKMAVGIDIDEEALIHAKKNAKLNHLNVKFSKKSPKRWPSQSIFLMNMIFSEQKELSPVQFNEKASLWIVSGILSSQKKTYLEHVKEWGWKLQEEKEEEGWCGFTFTL